jgi:hypothetical protein
MIRSPNYRTASPALSIPKALLQNIQGVTKLDRYDQISLGLVEIAPQLNLNGSGSLEGDRVLLLESYGPITGPYGTADNIYATADQDPEAPGFDADITLQMDYRADCDPRFQYIARATPRSFGYTAGYLTSTADAPNGIPTGSGIAFPQNPQVGDYFLRIDYFPQVLFRWDGKLWVRISKNVRTETGLQNGNDTSLLSGFINNSNVTVLTDGTTTTQAQGLSTILTQPLDPLPPIA